MEPDKNTDILERQLKTLGQKIRIDILRKLDNLRNPLTYSILQKEVLGTNPNSVNFSFHLKTLKNNNLINSSDGGYSLSSLGNQILKNILSIEQVLYDQNKEIMIRTSKYSKEPFNVKKIEEYLVNEGKLENILAKQIAKEVEDRLSKTNIEYLTAPLMREYINVVLLENGLEEIRHRLTRLGTPPFEVNKLFCNAEINPDNFLNKLGSDVSEQYLLLNILPKNLADMYLSGEITLFNLNYWSLRPLGFYLDSKIIVEQHLSGADNARDLIINLLLILKKLYPYFSEDILIGGFNKHILSKISPSQKNVNLIKLIISQISEYNHDRPNLKPCLSLEFTSNRADELSQQNSAFFDILSNRDIASPRILYDFSSKEDRKLIEQILNSNISKCITFYDGKNLLNSTNLNVFKFNKKNQTPQNRIILDKMSINLHLIALQSKQNDDIFRDLLQEKVISIFELFSLKQNCLKKRTKSSHVWKQLISEILNIESLNWIERSLKSISFFGLNEAVKHHCGIEIDRIETSEIFAKNLLLIIKDLINEKNVEENEKYILSQPHYGEYLRCLTPDKNLPADSYSASLFREKSTLELCKRIQLFKKFEPILDGGSVFYIRSDKGDLLNNFNKLADSKLKAFSIIN